MNTRKPDVEAVFQFNGTRCTPVRNGYRPAHMIMKGYLTSGTHTYYDVDSVAPDGRARGTITFLTPEAYPHSLWAGKEIAIHEGEHVVGYAVIVRVFNPLLEKADS